MKKMTDITVRRIISEPGDATRYDYLVYRDGPNEFTFAPCRNTFKYPQRINYFDVKGIDTNTIDNNTNTLSKEHGCNPYTLLECIRTVIELWEGEQDERNRNSIPKW